METINEPLYESILFEYIKYVEATLKTDKLKNMYLRNISIEKITEKIINSIIKNEDIYALERVYKLKKELLIKSININKLLITGNLKVIKWFYNKHKTDNLEFRYTEYAVDNAARNGHLELIEWFWEKSKTDNLEFRYTDNAVQWAAKKGHLDVIEWFWEKSKPDNLEFRYTDNAVDCAAHN